MSTTLITYLDYIKNWDEESQVNIQAIIDEQMMFVDLEDFSADSAVDNEFSTLIGLAMTVRDETIAADAVQIAADAAAVAAFWSFGLGMAAFAALETAEAILEKVISNKSTELNAKLQTIDTDIASASSPKVGSYVAAWKSNNVLIKNNASDGADATLCRSILMQFLAEVHRKEGSLTYDGFKKWVGSARKLYNSNEVVQVYDALDALNLSGHTDADVQQYFSTIADIQFQDALAISLVGSVSVFIMAFQLKIATSTVQLNARGFPVLETDENAVKMFESVSKFALVVAIVLSVVDTVFEILDIVDVVQKCKSMCDQLSGPIKKNYHDFFSSMLTASKNYNTAINTTQTP